MRWTGGAALLLAALTLSACGGSGGTGISGFPEGDGVYQQVPVAQRGEPVALAGPLLSGEGTLELTSLRGQVVVLNVWGSWCGPCRKEAPELVEAHRRLTGADAPEGPKVSFVGINVRDADPQALAFDKQYGITYPSIVDDGKLLLALRGAVPPNAIPTTLVLDPQGRIAARFSGAVTSRTLSGLVQDVITGTTPGAAASASAGATAPSAPSATAT
jgi:thiol-disulfide isomerase/thioredoxin